MQTFLALQDKVHWALNYVGLNTGEAISLAYAFLPLKEVRKEGW